MSKMDVAPVRHSEAMAEDPAVRETRLALLKSVNDLLARFADFRLVATDGQGRT